MNLEMAMQKAKGHAARGDGKKAVAIYQDILGKYPKNKRVRKAMEKLPSRGHVAPIGRERINPIALRKIQDLVNSGDWDNVLKAGRELLEVFPKYV
ncbi:MAG: hypothetical protein AAFX00_07635, partial [Pseudomonadota bacterium]